jgi:hypothetical protein
MDLRRLLIEFVNTVNTQHDNPHSSRRPLHNRQSYKSNDENGIEKGLKQKAVYKSINKLFCADYSLKPLSINTMLAHTTNCSYEN